MKLRAQETLVGGCLFQALAGAPAVKYRSGQSLPVKGSGSSGCTERCSCWHGHMGPGARWAASRMVTYAVLEDARALRLPP